MEHELTYEDSYLEVPALYKIAKMRYNAFKPKTRISLTSVSFRLFFYITLYNKS
jgi:hypothetical protein